MSPVTRVVWYVYHAAYGSLAVGDLPKGVGASEHVGWTRMPLKGVREEQS